MMKRRNAGAQFIAPFFIFLALALSASTHAFAQALPALEVSPSTLGADGVLTLSLPPNIAPPQGKSTLRVALYEHLRPTRIAEIKKKFALMNGRWSTSFRVEADPGSYDFRLVADDKYRAALSQTATLIIPGIVREPGWWLINGSPFIQAPPDDDLPMPSNAPLFVSGLKRDGKKFERKVLASGGSPFKWRVLPLPDTNGLIAPDFDFEVWRSKAQTAIRDAQARGERNLLGIVVRAPLLVREDARVITAGRRIRQIVNEIAPDAALILEIPKNGHYLYGNGVSAWAQFCDAVVVQRDPWREFSGGAGGWPIKVVRRVAEEQPNYDLPIFVATTQEEQEDEERSVPSGLNNELNPSSQLLRFWMSGASGTATFTGAPVQVWREIVARNASLFIGSPTLEDAGIWPPAEVPAPQAIEELYNTLLDAGRIPLLARVQSKQGKKIPESFLCVLGDSISGETIEKLRIAANGGARIYLEGSPKLEGDPILAAVRWSTLVGAASKPIEKKEVAMSLDDVWLFGASRGSKVLAIQSVQIGALNPPVKSASKKDEPEKGTDVLSEPRVVARLEDGSPALIENPVGDGAVLWSPHRVLASSPTAQTRDFYAAIAAHLGTGLVKIRAVDKGSTPSVRVAIRRSLRGTWLVGLFNSSDKSAPVVLEANHFAGVALDLATEKELPLQTRGNRSFVTTAIPANSWQIIALGETRKALDEERFAPRSKAKLK